MSGVIRALGRMFTLSKLHPDIFIATHIKKGVNHKIHKNDCLL